MALSFVSSALSEKAQQALAKSSPGDVLKFIFSVLLFVNIVTFLAFGLDKCLAKVAGSFFGGGRGRGGSLVMRGGTRIAESALLTLVLLGGTPGAYMAMRYFRHKTQKQSFQFQFNLIMFVQMVAVCGWLWTRGGGKDGEL